MPRLPKPAIRSRSRLTNSVPDKAQIFRIASSLDIECWRAVLSAIISLMRLPVSISRPLVALTSIVSGAMSEILSSITSRIATDGIAIMTHPTSASALAAS